MSHEASFNSGLKGYFLVYVFNFQCILLFYGMYLNRNMSNEEKLLQYLFTNYDPVARAVMDTSKPVVVGIDFVLLRIHGLVSESVAILSRVSVTLKEEHVMKFSLFKLLFQQWLYRITGRKKSSFNNNGLGYCCKYFTSRYVIFLPVYLKTVISPKCHRIKDNAFTIYKWNL